MKTKKQIRKDIEIYSHARSECAFTRGFYKGKVIAFREVLSK